MEQTRAQRRLVKSPPELWAELSDETALGRHLAEFGEIRITRLDPESTVAWEGDRASGTVQIEEAGWGTKVILTARDRPEAPAVEPVAPEPEPEPVAVEPEPEPLAPPPPPVAAEPEPEPQVVAAEPEPERRQGFFARLFRRKPPAAPEKPAMRVTPPRPRPAKAEVPAPEPSPPVPAPDPTPEPSPDPTPEPSPDPVPPLPDPDPPAPDPVPQPAPGPGPTQPPEIAAASGGGREFAGRELPGDPSADRVADIESVLASVLDDLGAAHHRPFSRE